MAENEKSATAAEKFVKIPKEEYDQILETIRRFNETKKQEVHETHEISVGCNAICGGGLKNNEYNIPLAYGQNPVPVDVAVLKSIFQSNAAKWRKLFENGVYYFENEEDYKLFRFEPKFSMSRDNIAKLLSLPTAEMAKKLQELVNKTHDATIFHTLFYRIIDLLSENRLQDVTLPSESRDYLESFFHSKISDALASYALFKKTPLRKQ